jgi:hypothetical protein
MSLRVVYATDTGHVLGAMALNGAGGKAPTVADLVGKELPLPVTLDKGEVAPVALSASMLDVAVVDDLPAALVVPWAFGVEVVGGTPRPALTPLDPVQHGSEPIAPVPEGVTVRLADNAVTVSLPANTTANTQLPVLAVVVNAGGPRTPLRGQIGSGKSDVQFSMKLEPGSYGVLALVAGWRGWLDRANVQ